MAATYNASLTSLRDHIRLLLGDTNTSAAMLQDETIDALLTAYGWSEAVAQLADSLVARYAQRPDSYRETGGAAFSFAQRIPAWRELAARARAGKLPHPTATARTVAGPAQGTLTVQSAAAGDSDTLMEDFRSD